MYVLSVCMPTTSTKSSDRCIVKHGHGYLVGHWDDRGLIDSVNKNKYGHYFARTFVKWPTQTECESLISSSNNNAL